MPTWLDVGRWVVALRRLRRRLLQLGRVDTKLSVHPLPEQGQLLATTDRVPVIGTHTSGRDIPSPLIGYLPQDGTSLPDTDQKPATGPDIPPCH